MLLLIALFLTFFTGIKIGFFMGKKFGHYQGFIAGKTSDLALFEVTKRKETL